VLGSSQQQRRFEKSHLGSPSDAAKREASLLWYRLTIGSSAIGISFCGKHGMYVAHVSLNA
jgi:hypothetical protein